MDTKSQPVLLSVKTAAGYLGVKPATVREALRTKRLNGYKPLGGNWRISTRDLAAFMLIDTLPRAMLKDSGYYE